MAFYKKNNILGQKRAGSESHDLLSKFWDPSVTFERVKIDTSFLRASAMLKHVIAIGLTSVRPSHSGIVSKRLNILSCFLRHTIAHSF